MISFAPGTRWIWDDGEPAPRNAWRCFRRRFAADKGGTALLRITADTRYVVFVNGTRIGHGPVRAFAQEWPVDTWDIWWHLREYRWNTVAVLVAHNGVATFQSLPGRGGLLAELDLGRQVIGTDSGWEVATHGGHDPRAPRLGPQLAFTEDVDGAWQPDWADGGDAYEGTYPTGIAAGWAPATEIAAPGDGPWTTLVPRPIPPLQEEIVAPAAVHGVEGARPWAGSWTVDVRAVFDPTSPGHANPSAYGGYLLTALTVPEPGATRPVALGLPLSTAHARVRGVAVDGRHLEIRDLTRGPVDLRTLELDLPPGRHWLALDVSTYDHGYPLPLLLDGADLTHPWQPDAPSPFVALGPVPDPGPAFFRPLAHPTRPPVTPTPQVGAAVAALTATRDPRAVPLPASTVPAALVATTSGYGQVVHPRAQRPLAIDVTGLTRGEPVTLPDGDDVSIVLDLGIEASGFVIVDLDAPAGTVVDVYGFEYVDGPRRQETTGMDNTLRYRTRAGRQRYESPVRRGLRYLQVVVRRDGATPGPVTLHEVAVRNSHYPVDRAGEFVASDVRLTEIWEMSRRTVIACMEDTFVDCPVYEQAFWVGDTYSSARFASSLFDASALIERSLRLVPGSKAQTPLLGSQVPSGWTNVIPAWTFFWVLACAEHAARTGDEAFARDLLPEAVATLDAFAEHLDPDGLLSIEAWNLLDWAPMDQPDAGVVTHQNALFVMALDAAAELADRTGAPDVAGGLRARAAALRTAIATHLWSPEREAFIDAIHADGTRSEVISVQTQMFAHLAGVGTEPQRERTRALVVDPPSDLVQIGSPWMSIFRYDVLEAAGRADVALADLRRDYGAMIEAGAVTCWEMFPAPDREWPTRSHCHAWSAAPASFLPAVVLGITVHDGGGRVEIAPHPGELEWARGAVPLPGGTRVQVAWTRDGDALDLRVGVPAEVEVTVTEPAGLRTRVRVEGPW
ncbi:alpha-L-rhamnosidase [Occultella glacieicola]|uniref:Alpha-L-rhamnosidase n=1 Tax=Occultella glacieicola TaxID=2518684 RepID=A0ABY2E728_9MICO|nr:family 78 glycoside hydrolase catalytic domain [Occultella glacieicola]TDE97363.1 alpha-L-rhamnosidase [Occultella glacieicola]